MKVGQSAIVQMPLPAISYSMPEAVLQSTRSSGKVDRKTQMERMFELHEKTLAIKTETRQRQQRSNEAAENQRNIIGPLTILEEIKRRDREVVGTLQRDLDTVSVLEQSSEDPSVQEPEPIDPDENTVETESSSLTVDLEGSFSSTPAQSTAIIIDTNHVANIEVSADVIINDHPTGVGRCHCYVWTEKLIWRGCLISMKKLFQFRRRPYNESSREDTVVPTEADDPQNIKELGPLDVLERIKRKDREVDMWYRMELDVTEDQGVQDAEPIKPWSDKSTIDCETESSTLPVEDFSTPISIWSKIETDHFMSIDETADVIIADHPTERDSD